jgi:nitrogen regulatory protein PII
MMETVQRRKIEVLVDAPLARRITQTADEVGVTGYTIMPTLGGGGRGGRWQDDQVSGADAKVIFVTVTNDAKAEAFIEAVAPFLESHRLILMTSIVEVLRPGKF